MRLMFPAALTVQALGAKVLEQSMNVLGNLEC